MKLYNIHEQGRMIEESASGSTSHDDSYRSSFRKDYSRLIHCPAFRRLQGKTQLYPSHENDFFRTRLTHSLEVAQIAKTIALKINHSHKLTSDLAIDTDLVEFAALAHDIGHPPFGHQGEEALDEYMIPYGGFEGNAQTLRIVSRLEKKHKLEKNFNNGDDLRVGLNLTYRTIASILKYDNIIPSDKVGRESYAKAHGLSHPEPVKGYYECEADVIEQVKKAVLDGYPLQTGKGGDGKSAEHFKTIECRIMDIADDIAYSTYDLDDTLKAKFCNPFDIVFPNSDIVNRISEKTSKIFKKQITPDQVLDVLYDIFGNLFRIEGEQDEDIARGLESGQINLEDALRAYYNNRYISGKMLANDGFKRNAFTSNLVNTFVNGVEYTAHPTLPALSSVKIKDNIKLQVEVLKTFNYEVNIMSHRLKIPAYRGKQIVKEIFQILHEDADGFLLLPDDYKALYIECANSNQRARVICDFISGMTDKYCIEFYARLTSENAETMFKPI